MSTNIKVPHKLIGSSTNSMVVDSSYIGYNSGTVLDILNETITESNGYLKLVIDGLYDDGVDNNGHDYVDLGLIDSSGNTIYWSTCNVGAEKQTDYGSYITWSETGTESTYTNGIKKSYAYENSKYYSSGYTKYNDDDELTTLELVDDAANVNFGGDWYTPSFEEYTLLVEECTWTWQNSENTEFNGICGYKVVGPNGNYIFLPACGEYYDYYGNTELNAGGEFGYYVTRILSSDDNTYAICGVFDENSIYSGYEDGYIGSDDSWFWVSRDDGCSVRPVIKKRTSTYKLITDVKNDDKIYGRQNGEWKECLDEKGSVLKLLIDGVSDFVDTSTLTFRTYIFSKNIGASSYIDKGLYFGIGSVEGVNKTPTTNVNTKYYAELDPARYNLGGGWKVPSKKIFDEILAYSYVKTDYTDGVRLKSLSGICMDFPFGCKMMLSDSSSNGLFQYVETIDSSAKLTSVATDMFIFKTGTPTDLNVRPICDSSVLRFLKAPMLPANNTEYYLSRVSGEDSVWETKPFIYLNNGIKMNGGENTINLGGNDSLVSGYGNTTNNGCEIALGRYNISVKEVMDSGGYDYPNQPYLLSNILTAGTIHSIGIGRTGSNKNAEETKTNGLKYVYGIGNYDGTNGSDTSTIKSVNSILKRINVSNTDSSYIDFRYCNDISGIVDSSNLISFSATNSSVNFVNDGSNYYVFEFYKDLPRLVSVYISNSTLTNKSIGCSLSDTWHDLSELTDNTIFVDGTQSGRYVKEELTYNVDSIGDIFMILSHNKLILNIKVNSDTDITDITVMFTDCLTSSTNSVYTFENCPGYRLSFKPGSPFVSSVSPQEVFAITSNPNSYTYNNTLLATDDNKVYVKGIGGYDGSNIDNTDVKDIASVINSKVDLSVIPTALTMNTLEGISVAHTVLSDLSKLMDIIGDSSLQTTALNIRSAINELLNIIIDDELALSRSINNINSRVMALESLANADVIANITSSLTLSNNNMYAGYPLSINAVGSISLPEDVSSSYVESVVISGNGEKVAGTGVEMIDSSTTVSDTTTFTLTAKIKSPYLKTLSNSATVTKVTPIYISIIDSSIDTVDSVVSLIVNDSNLYSADAPVSTIKSITNKSFTFNDNLKLAFICGDSDVLIKEVGATSNETYSLTGSVLLNGMTAYIYVTENYTSSTKNIDFNA